MRLVDTSAWIECLTGSPIGLKLAAELPESGEWLVPTVVQLELSKWLTREAGEDKADQVIAFTTTCEVADLDDGDRAVGGGTMRQAQAGDGRCDHIRNRLGL